MAHRRAPARARPGRARAPQPRARRADALPRGGRRGLRLGRLPRAASSEALRAGRLRRPARRAGARARRRAGCSASAWPAWSSRRVSNMGYITLAQTAEERARGLPKSGNAEGVTIAMGPHGGVTLRITTTPQGQGHRTVAAQVAADVLGLEPEQIDVRTDADTAANPWTVSLRQLLEPLRRDGRHAPCTSPPSSSPTACGRIAAPILAARAGRDRARRGRRARARRRGAQRARCAAWPAPRTGTRATSPARPREGLALTVTYTLPIAPPDDDDRVNSSGLLRLHRRRVPSSRSTRRPARSRCAPTSRCTTPAACSTRCSPTARSAAASRTASAPRCSRSTATTRTATS